MQLGVGNMAIKKLIMILSYDDLDRWLNCDMAYSFLLCNNANVHINRTRTISSIMMKIEILV